MEGVGARLGRSSTRYGPATVFSGPVRKWKKRWVHISPSNTSSSSHHSHHQTAMATTTASATGNGNNGSQLLLYKWTPITPSQNNNNSNGTSNGDSKSSSKDEAIEAEEPPRRKFKYIPVAVLEELKNEAVEQVEDKVKPIGIDTNAAEPTSKSDDLNEKPDINDMPMEENQAPADNPLQRQDLNESTLDLSLGLKAHDGDRNSNSITDQTKDGRLERVASNT